MKFLLDESTEYRIAAFLTDQGHDVAAIAHDYPAALPDGEVLAIAKREQRILITNDADFGELVFRHKQRHSGVILFRMGSGKHSVEDGCSGSRAAFSCRSSRPISGHRPARSARTPCRQNMKLTPGILPSPGASRASRSTSDTQLPPSVSRFRSRWLTLSENWHTQSRRTA